MNQVFKEKKIPDKRFYHDPTIRDNDNWTVAMYLVYNSIIPPK